MRENQYIIAGYGALVDKNPGQCMTENTIEDAEDSFVGAKERLLDINNWNKYSPMADISFRLSDGHGRPVKRKAHKGDHVKIDLPGPSAHYCAVIEAIEYDDYPDLDMETFTLRLRPCVHSRTEEDDDVVEGALIIERRSRQIFTAFQSRYAMDHTSSSGGFCGLSDQEWERLSNKFVV